MYRITHALPSELRKILRVTLSAPQYSSGALEDQVSGLIEYGRAMQLDLSRNWWCHLDGNLASACTCVESAGHSALIFVPFGGTLEGHGAAFEIMMSHVLSEERNRGIKLIQCLLQTDDHRSAKLLMQQGFRQIAELIYMERDSSAFATTSSTLSEEHEWISYSPQLHALFSETIALTYDGSMDCHGLSGLREMDDIMAAHMGAGLFVPQRWLIIMIDRVPAGCILLAENPLDHHLEVAYMGVCPAFRGRQLGRALVRKALEVAHHAGLHKLTLAVDAVNLPARKVYDGLNFTESTRRMAWVRPLISNPI